MSASGSDGPAGSPTTPVKRKRNNNKVTPVKRNHVASQRPSTSSESSQSPFEQEKDIVGESLEKLATHTWKSIPKVFSQSRKDPSEAWDSFHVVVDGANVEVGTAQCIVCSAVLVYYNSQVGPSSLLKHRKKYCKAQLGEASQAPSRPVPSGLRDVFVDKVADTCALTMGAVDLLTGDAVVEMVQVAVDIATRCKGRVDVRALMPSRVTVMDRIDARAAAATKELVPQLRVAIREDKVQGSTDMWTEDHSKNHFLAITTTYTDEAGQPQTHDLATTKFPASTRATGANIRAAMQDKLQSIGIPPEEFEKIQWVTDRGANVRKALEDLPREDCSAHVINTVVRSSLSVPYYELRQEAVDALSPLAREVLATVEAAVKAVKAAPPALVVKGVALDALQKALVLPQAQWNNKYAAMLSSVCVGKAKVLAVLTSVGENDLANRLRAVNKDIVSDISNFLSPLEKNKTVPSSDLASLKRHLTIQAGDSDETLRMKEAVADLRVLLDILILIKEAKEVVQLLKSTGLASLLQKKVLQEVDTRWNSIHTMLTSVLHSYDEIVGVLAEHGEGAQRRRMEKIDRGMLQWLTDFLEEFKAETKILEGNDHPTLPCVLLAFFNLRDHCEPGLLDCNHLEVLKKRFQFFLRSKFQPSMKAKIATFLWPDYKELSMLPECEREEVKAKVRALIADPEPEPDDVQEAQADTLEPPVPKVSRLDRYSRYRVALPATTRPMDEVDKYLATSVSVPPDQLLQHWKMLDRPDGFPKLAKLALRELGKLATAAPSERVWSKAGFILNKRRNRLTPTHLNSIIVLGSYLRLKKKNEKK
ncbi:Transposable element Hobo transposase [Frankliniella fusca]|uniref:Transposable element Hobo transposase n=1 Tax=Frankliniella fusca TaxID=407009 RepID=A0AAE1I2D8_9NEOP|nr:Transposable element Hobo transposase [Frankliniella fusca]